MQSENESSPAGTAGPKGKLPSVARSRMMAAAIGLGGMIVGSIVGIGVQKGVESTGLLGPSVETLIAEQKSNFSDVTARLDEIRNMTGDSDVKANLGELSKLLARQDQLAQQANSELAHLSEQVAAMRRQQLEESGFSGGADFWLKAGESVSVGNRDQVFGLIGARSTIADINLSGTRKRVALGDAIPVPGEARSCTIFYKQATPRADGRIGFDLSCG